ncbi:hypothetical protein [Bradyrhizobium brasilense]|uniref:hypothetical protein n=1 Tax=Bradyrhizobium brasilense TaxID=1419277 RepID=UPI001E53C303|nr:hypothetical protein [Bradyrhizobium brasilense]MCC8972027.1 hypothetical protein [Bradyrhizobium brasilense]
MDNPFPSSPAALMQVQRAAAEDREAGEAFEQQLTSAGEPREETALYAGPVGFQPARRFKVTCL